MWGADGLAGPREVDSKSQLAAASEPSANDTSLSQAVLSPLQQM